MKDLSIIVGNFTGSKSFEFIVVGKRNKVVGCSWGYIFNDGHFGGEGKDEDPYPRIYLTDINGNGKNEVMIINRQDAYFYEWDDLSKKFKKLSDTAFQGINYKNITYLGDFNGDGCTDFLTKNNKTPYNWVLFLSVGKNTLMTVNRSDPYGNILDYLNKKKQEGLIFMILRI
ncbi:MAG: FG-GAP repeat domain-containing protein [Clostridium baratii]